MAQIPGVNSHSSPLKSVLVTGFEPFGVHATNPSGLVAEALDGRLVGGGRVVGVRLPVHWHDAGLMLTAWLATDPALVVLLGLAGTATTIRVEMQAVNQAGPILDNAGALPPTALLQADGPPVRASRWPGAALVQALQAAGLPATLSDDAGLYLCNATLYHALGWAATQAVPPPVGFVHLPPLLDAEHPDGLPLADQIRAVRLVIETLLDAQVATIGGDPGDTVE